MPSWVIQLLIGLVPIFSKIFDKLFPEKHVPIIRKAAKWAVNPTVEALARMEEKRQAKLLRGG